MIGGYLKLDLMKCMYWLKCWDSFLYPWSQSFNFLFGEYRQWQIFPHLWYRLRGVFFFLLVGTCFFLRLPETTRLDKISMSIAPPLRLRTVDSSGKIMKWLFCTHAYAKFRTLTGRWGAKDELVQGGVVFVRNTELIVWCRWPAWESFKYQSNAY